VTKLDITGVPAGELPKVRELLGVRAGMMFSRKVIASGVAAVRTLYADQAFAYVEVAPNTRLDRTHDSMEMTVEIKKGKPARFGTIRISGNQRTPEATIRNALVVTAGKPFNETALETSKRKALALGLADVIVSTRRGGSDELVDVSFEVQEAP
jgi:outer membrane protein insertion porin family